jgi:hypothetical protein
MKYFHRLFFINMLIFASLQWNDIDRFLWVSIYVVAALLALIAYTNICQTCTIAWACLLIVFSVYLLVALAPGISDYLEANAYTEIFFGMKEDKSYIEQTREAMGILIILFYCVCLLIHRAIKRN